MAYLHLLGCMATDTRKVQEAGEGCRTFPRPWRASEMIAQEKAAGTTQPQANLGTYQHHPGIGVLAGVNGRNGING